MSPFFITIAVPFEADRLASTERALDAIGNPMRPDLQAKLDRQASVHFVSINAVPPEAEDTQAHLVVEMTSDDPAEIAVPRWADALGSALVDVLVAADVIRHGESAASFLSRRQWRIETGTGWLSTPGIAFSGAPQMSVQRILDEAALAARAMTLIARTDRSQPSALAILKGVRAQVEKERRLAHLLIFADTPFLRGEQRTVSQAIPLLLRSALGTLLAPIAWLVGLGAAGALIWGMVSALQHGSGGLAAALAGASAAFWFLVGSVVVLAVAAVAGYVALRRREADDIPDDSAPDAGRLEAVVARENALIHGAPEPEGELHDPGSRMGGTAVVQNHLLGISAMKPGLLRLMTLRLAFWAIGFLATHVFRPGFLGEIGTIHAARWVLLPGTRQLLFFSNFGGSWESYLEDFITKAHGGLTGVWSNTEGFPRTSNLFGDGATDGDRFKRWARRQQWPTRAWYSAYPHLTTARLRANAAIRNGLASAQTESEALAWLANFNSAPTTAEKLEAADIQALAYGGVNRFASARALVIHMGETAERNREWLADVESIVTTAQAIPQESACVIGLSAQGLGKLGISRAVLETFPAAFQHGMDAPWRARLLGDLGDDAPENWRWGNGDSPAHAILLLYADSRVAVEAMAAQETARARSFGLDATAVINLHDRAQAKSAATGMTSALQAVGREHQATRRLDAEPFGFADGVSQPIIKGTPRALKHPDETDHLVEAGEFILGYPDNRGFLPPTPSVRAGEDEDNQLTSVPRDPRGAQDEVGEAGAGPLRDLGRNGSFLVVRQLQQHVETFERFLNEAAGRLTAEERSFIELPQGATLPEWIGAKMLGRWRDGDSMARHASARAPKGGRWQADNKFRYGEDDPSGFGCPLGAHVRRTNPRESLRPGSAEQLAITNRHRILRAGRVYHGENGETGLLFVCLNADIERQFEFVQQTWCVATQFHGIDNEADPILGRRLKSTHFTIPTPKGPIRLEGLEKFITVRGGGYFFMPSRRALKWMAHPHSSAQPKLLPQGQERAA